MNDRFYRVATIGTGTLWIGPRPQAESLSDWAGQAAALDITHVLSLIEEAEVERYCLAVEGRALEPHDISFARFPIDDFDVPDSGKFHLLINDLMKRLSAGENLFLHCAGGVGRAGTTACCVLGRNGMRPDQAMELVSAARGQPVPETDAQKDFIRSFFDDV